ncbi:TPA: ABC transporter I member 20 [Trebouxia sp. C0005]
MPRQSSSVSAADVSDELPLSINSLSYAYPGALPVISDFTLHLPRGSRCLLLGANGAGDLSYLGAQWRRDVAFAGYNIALQGDLAAGEMIHGVEGVDPNRRQQLIDLLDIDLQWRLNRVSDGQRRRVQICMGLLKPYKVLLLDEVTVDMDVVARLDLLDFFRQECEVRGATIVYATHIFDGLEGWLTHLAFISQGNLLKGGPIGEITDMGDAKLLKTVERWLRTERNAVRKSDHGTPLNSLHKGPGANGTDTQQKPASKQPAPFFPSRHMAYFH